MEKPKACHFHGSALHPGTHIMRISCPGCDDYHIVYTCETCTKAVRTYEEPSVSALTMSCSHCRKTVLVRERWRILGKV